MIVPTCKRCGQQHYNLHPCPEVKPPTPPFYRTGENWRDRTYGEVTGAGTYWVKREPLKTGGHGQ